jgi:hypothetical protein
MQQRTVHPCHLTSAFSCRRFTVVNLVAGLEVLKELVPGATKIALLSNPEHSGELAEYRVTDEAARRLGASMTRYIVRTPQELATMLEAIRTARSEAMIVFRTR